MKNLVRLGQTVETNCKEFPKLWLVKTGNGYGVMVLHWLESENRANGWFFGTTGSLKECRSYIRNF